MPAIAPPWGTLNAIDLVTGRHSLEGAARRVSAARRERHPQHGQHELRRRRRHRRRPRFSSPRRRTRRFAPSRSHSGRVLWEHALPAGGYATPSVYMVDGRQYVAIAAGGGGKNATKSGDSIVAFALAEDPVVQKPAGSSRAGQRRRLDRPLRRRHPERLGALERRAHLHGRGRRDCRPDRRSAAPA